MATNADLCKYAREHIGAPIFPVIISDVASPIALQQLAEQTYDALFPRMIGTANRRRVFGDAGLINGFIGTSYSPDEIYSASNIKGSMSGFPGMEGLLVFVDGHVGIYVGGGKVIEACRDSIIEANLKARNWQRWCYCPFIAYPAVNTAPTPKKRRRKKV